MTYTSIFGQDLSDYDIQVLIDNGVAEQSWRAATQQLAAFERNRGRNAPQSVARKIFQAAGIAGSAWSAAKAVWAMNNNRREQSSEGRLRGTSFYNSQWDEQVPGEHTK